MRFLSLTLTILLFVDAFGQRRNEKLTYFVGKDSLIGVKNQNGKIIIPATQRTGFDISGIKEIKGNLIYFDSANGSARPPFSGNVYDRAGNFLFLSFMVDNGPDYFSEGLTRFVKNGKMGFVNRIGKILLDAQWDFVSEFNYGIAIYCKGCHWEYNKDDEQVFAYGGRWGFINSQGHELIPTIKKHSIKDQHLSDEYEKEDSGKYLKYQFHYSNFEQKIIDSFSKLKIISKAYWSQISPSDVDDKLKFEIVERPSYFFPYYHVKAFAFSKNFGYQGDEKDMPNFFVTKDGKTWYYANETIHYSGQMELTPFKIWLRKYTEEAKEYLKSRK